MRTADEQRAGIFGTWVSVAVNLTLVALQIAVGLFARSQALVADGMHSASDVVADAIVLIAARHGNAAADANHPYGHMRFETFASLVLGLILVATGLGLSYAAAIRLASGQALAALHPAALVVALFTLACKEGLFRYLRRIGERLGSTMFVANAWHARADAASSLVVALGIAANLAGVHAMDAVAAAIVGLMVAYSGLKFAWGAFNDLTDHALGDAQVREIERTILAVEGVRGIHQLRTRRMGDWASVDVHVLVDSHLSVSEGHFIAERVRDAVRVEHRVIEAVVHIDPADANDVGRLLNQPPRPALVKALARHVPAEVLARHCLRLHYLDSGLELEVELAADTGAEEQAVIERGLQALMDEGVEQLRGTRVSRTVDPSAGGAHAAAPAH